MPTGLFQTRVLEQGYYMNYAIPKSVVPVNQLLSWDNIIYLPYTTDLDKRAASFYIYFCMI